ncbi:MAG TPA: FHA domain-containing protein [Stellaceae bacterium]|nr:FHA domain-containing protein [Stellaceae bacterium]
MEPVIWVEILSRHREVAQRHRFAAPEVRIGRGYDNDLVLDDPDVAVHHLRVFRAETGDLVAEDCGSANGLYRDGDRRRQQRVILDGDTVLRIGGVHLRVREPGYAVPRERAQRPPARLWPAAAGLAAAILGLEALSLWLAETGEPKASHYVMPLLGLAGITLIWTAGWAVLSRVFAGRAQFERGLVIALSGLLAFALYAEFAPFAAFALAWRGPATYEYVAMWSILGAICYAHLHALGARRRLSAAAVAALSLLAIAAQALTQSEARAVLGQQSYLHRLLPPTLRLAPLQDETAFFAGVEELKSRLDRDRASEPAAESGP